MPALRWPSIPRLPALIGAGALLALALALGVRMQTRDWTIGLSLLAVTALQAVAGWAALRAADRGRTVPAGAAWRYFGTGWLLLAVSGALRWGGWMLAGEIPRVPSLVELFRLAGVCSILWGAASYAAFPQERFGRLRQWLDVAILLPAVLGVSWLALARPVLRVVGDSEAAALWALAWPIFGLGYLTLLLRLTLSARVGAERRSLGLLLTGGVAALVADLISGYGLFTVTPASLPTLSGLRAAGAALAAVAAWQARVALAEPPARARPRTPRLEALLPIAYAYAVVGLTAVDAWLEGTIDQFGLGMSIALTLLVFARQGVVAGQSEMRQYAALVEGAADMAFICRADGVISLSNPAFADALRLGPDSALGIRLEDVLADGGPSGELLEAAAGSGWEGEVAFRRRDGTRFPARLSLRPVRLERQPKPVLAASAVDLTRVKEREALLRSALDDVAAARADLEALNRDLEAKVEDRTRRLQQTVEDLDRLNRDLRALDRLKSEFVTLVSHELRAPLTNIRTGLELIGDDPEIPEDPRASLDLIRTETERLGTFVEAILDLSALEAGRFPLRLEPLDPGRVAEEAAARFQPAPAGRRIVVAPQVSRRRVLADPKGLASVLYHLIDNALKYAASGDVVVEAGEQGDPVELSVRDHGAGIPQDDRESVFDPFHRLDASDARQVYGHGLGLHLVRRILEAMGGGIRLDPAEGGGSRFTFWLPRADPAPDASGSPSQAATAAEPPA